MRRSIFAFVLAAGGLAALAIMIVSSALGQPATGGATAPATAAPLTALGLYLDGFHYRDGHPGEQMEVAHYCGNVSADLIQCALFDGTTPGAKLIGIEYVISADILRRLPEDERALWHSHAYEVKSGALTAPGMPATDEHDLMSGLAKTYGKTWHTWQVGQTLSRELPLGRPALMMAFTRDGQINDALLSQRDQKLGVNTAAKVNARADIPQPSLVPGVDRGENGRSCAPASPGPIGR